MCIKRRPEIKIANFGPLSKMGNFLLFNPRSKLSRIESLNFEFESILIKFEISNFIWLLLNNNLVLYLVKKNLVNLPRAVCLVASRYSNILFLQKYVRIMWKISRFYENWCEKSNAKLVQRKNVITHCSDARKQITWGEPPCSEF